MIRFINNLEELYNDKDFIVTISLNGDKEKILTEFKETLQLPIYFGENWDALYDCLCDLSWIDNHNIVIFHNDISNVDKVLLKIYVKILKDTIEVWFGNDKKNFSAVFLEKDKPKIIELLNEEQ